MTHAQTLRDLDVATVVQSVRSGQIAAAALLDAYLERIDTADSSIHAYLSVNREGARRQAEAIDKRVAGGDDPGPLAGVVMGLKDNLSTRGWPTTCASKILEGFEPVFDATAVERLREAGATVIGKTNMDEFAMGSSTETSAFGATHNPWKLGRVPGGSSGGSAAAVAAGMCLGSLGSDTGGSVRQPGAFCGLVALKPHYGNISRYGLVAFASSLDQIGPMGRSAGDVARLYNVVSGHDPRDATSRAQVTPIDLEAIEEPPQGMTLGVPRSWLREGLDPDVARVCEETEARYRNLGARFVDVDLPGTDAILATYYILADAEASSNLARYDGVRYGPRHLSATSLQDLYESTRGEGFGLEVKRRILLGTFVLSSGYYDAYYGRAQRAREWLRERFATALETCDAILMPASPVPAFRMGEKLSDPLAMYLCDIFTLSANVLGNPAVAFPAGSSADGLPVGMQWLGRSCSETMLLRLVRAHETVYSGPGVLSGPDSPLHRTAFAAEAP